jgi:hypothetical protein
MNEVFLNNKLDEVTNFLCYTLAKLDSKTLSNLLSMNPQLHEWWVDHRERDRKRAEREAAAAKEERQRLAALKKLTKAERKLLGL